MLSLVFDNKSSWQLRWPKSDDNIIRLGELYVAYESGLPVEEQLAAPPLALVQTALTAAQTAVANAAAGEETRAMAAEVFRQKMATAQKQLKYALQQLKLHHRHNLAELEAWGVKTVYGQDGILVRLPHRQANWLAFLDKYIAKESSLPPEAQLTEPVLSDMITLRDEIQSQYQARTQGRLQRKENIASRRQATSRLNELLKLAAGVRVVITYEGQLAPALGAWGYKVIQRVPAATEATTAPPTEPATVMSMSLSKEPATNGQPLPV